MSKITRVICLLLALFMLQIPALALPAQAEEAEEIIEIKDPGFEETEGDFLKHWSHMDTEGAYFEVDTQTKKSGKSSVHIHNVSASNPWAAQGKIKGLKEGSMYALSVFMNVDLQTGDGASIKVEYVDKAGNHMTAHAGSHEDNYPYGRYIPSTNNRWQEHITIFKVPKGAATAKVYVRLYGTGHAWFDDISLKFSGGPEPFRFDTNRVFHYKETKEGGAYVVLDPYYTDSDTEKDTKVDFEVLDGETVLAKEENVKFKNLEATFKYSTDGMTPYKPYALNCRIKDKDGNILQSHSRNVYVVDRPTVLDENGDFVIDGKKLNPIIAYHAESGDFEQIKASGHNVIIAGNDPGADPRLTIEAIKKYGFYVIVALYQYPFNAAHPDKIEDTKEMIKTWREVPNVIGYAMQDEPWLVGENLETREYAERAYLLAREMDPARSVVLTDKRFDYITSQYCDTYILDSYANGKNTALVSEESMAAWEWTKDKNSFWELAAAYYGTTVPSVNAARNSVYRAFEEGARGMGYYAFSTAFKSRPGFEYTPQLYHWEDWDEFCTLNNVEAPILFDRFVNGEAIVFNEFDDGNGIRSMKWFNWFVGDDMYLVAHNRSQEEQTVKIPLKSANGKVSISGFKAEPIGLTTQAEIKGKSSIELTLGAEEIALYKITPDQKVDLSKVMEPADEAPETPVEAGVFADLAGYEWAKDAIEALYEDGIVNAKEEGVYAPGEAITRLDFVSALVRALGLTEEGEAFPDCDVSEIKAARAAGITNGDTDGNFRPYDTITRQDIMTTAVRALNAGLSEAEIPEFSDWSLVSDYALEAVQVMTQAGVIKGNGDGTLNPLGNATRAEAAVMLERMLGTEFTEKPNPDEIREEIEFTSKVEETALQNWSDAADLIKGLGIASPELEKSVTKGDFEAAVSNLLGTNYDAFAENNKAITYAEAVEALVKLLGYEAYAPSRGGFMAMAAQLDLTKGLSPETYIRGGELCVLLENAIKIKMAERTDFGGNETYKESDDTLLSAYRNIYKHKGIVEGNYYTNSALKKGEILIDNEIFTGGEGFFKQRVIAYAENTGDEKKILYIKAANDTEVITVDTEEILEADTSKIRIEKENGKDEIYSITGAQLYVNGEKKVLDGEVLRPDMGSVTLISLGGTVTTILVEKYENRIVESVFADENTVYFKNGKELVLNTEKERFYMDFDLKSLKEWNVLSVMLRGEKPYKVMVSDKTVQGAPSETSSDGILLGETIYPVAKACFGTPVLGTEAIFHLDFTGKVAAVNDEGVTREYGYFTTLAGGKGLNGGVSIRIFTKKGEMKVFTAADNMKLNGTPVTETELVSDTRLMQNNTPIGQLVVYEVNEQDEVTSMDLAIDAENCTNLKAPKEFSKVYTTSGYGGEFDGHSLGTLGTLYRIDASTVTFTVPQEYSNDPYDYKVSMGKKDYHHGTVKSGIILYDWKEDFTIGAAVQVEEVKPIVEPGSTQAIFLGLGEALDKDGLPAKCLRVYDMDGMERTYYADADMKVLLDGATFSDPTNAAETARTFKDGTYVLKADMPFESLNVGDVIQYSATGSNISAIRCLFRVKSPKIGEHVDKTNGGVGTINPKRFMGTLAIAYAPVQRVFSDGFSMTPNKDERLFLHYNSGGTSRVTIFDTKTGKYQITNTSAMHTGDMVFSTRTNTYQGLIIVYR